jgi:hypothetical protein
VDIDEKTNIPLFAVIIAVPFLVGAVLWLASVDSKASDAKEQINGIKEMLIDTHDRIIRIEEKVNHR